MQLAGIKRSHEIGFRCWFAVCLYLAMNSHNYSVMCGVVFYIDIALKTLFQKCQKP